MTEASHTDRYIAAIRKERDGRPTNARYQAGDAGYWAWSIRCALLDAHMAKTEEELQAAVELAFRYEVALLAGMTRLADAAPNAARQGREYGLRLRAAAERGAEISAAERAAEIAAEEALG